MNDEERDQERRDDGNEDAGERDLRYGEPFGTQRDRSSAEEDGYLDPEDGRAEGGERGQREGQRDLRYGEPFGTQRDRSEPEEGGYLDAEFGSREVTPPQQDEATETEDGEPEP